jgi:hypothetical protein
LRKAKFAQCVAQYRAQLSAELSSSRNTQAAFEPTDIFPQDISLRLAYIVLLFSGCQPVAWHQQYRALSTVVPSSNCAVVANDSATFQAAELWLPLFALQYALPYNVPLVVPELYFTFHSFWLSEPNPGVVLQFADCELPVPTV